MTDDSSRAPVASTDLAPTWPRQPQRVTDGDDDAMPRFYFDVEFGSVFLDDHGVGLPDVRAARNVALDTLAEVLRGAGEEFWRAGGCFRLTAQDKQRRPLFRIDVTGRDV